nr:MAG: hypothetical protein DIU67_03480 [Actinomycetota bacterium]
MDRVRTRRDVPPHLRPLAGADRGGRPHPHPRAGQAVSRRGDRRRRRVRRVLPHRRGGREAPHRRRAAHHRAHPPDVHRLPPRRRVGGHHPVELPGDDPHGVRGPGLATGNALIVKPPEFTCWALLEMARVFEEAGVPKGAISIIPGAGEIGEALVTHPGIDAIGFTGSSATGRRIVSQMGLKRSIMEMSGNGPTIVTADADIEKAAQAAVYGAYYNAGQVCVATERLIVLDEVHDEFVEAAMKAAEEVRLGDPFDESTNMGPLNNEPTAQKMDRHVADAIERGADVLMGGKRASGHPTDLYYEFTIIDRVPEESLVSQEESFGPVLPILTAKDDDDAIGVANRTRLGLQAAVFTNDLTKAFYYADRIRSGTVIVNDSTDTWETFQPFGGAAGTDTGWGRQRIHEFCDLQTVVFSLRDEL